MNKKYTLPALLATAVVALPAGAATWAATRPSSAKPTPTPTRTAHSSSHKKTSTHKASTSGAAHKYTGPSEDMQ